MSPYDGVCVPLCWVSGACVGVVLQMWDQDMHPAHAVFQELESDLLVSFSGCAFMAGAKTCADVYHEYVGLVFFSSSLLLPKLSELHDKSHGARTLPPPPLPNTHTHLNL